VTQLGERLAPHRVLAIDTAIWIYHIEQHPRYRSLTGEILRGVQEGRWEAVTSVITLLEITVLPWRLGREGAAREYEALLAHFPHLRVMDVDRDVARVAARLRGQYGVHTADALQAAAALHGGATALVTNDRRLRSLGQVLEIVVLDEIAPA